MIEEKERHADPIDPESAMRLAIQMAAEKIQSGDDKDGA